MNGNSKDETNFLHKLLLTNRQVANLRKLSKTQISKMIQSVGFLGRLLGPLLKTGLPLIKNVIKSLAKSVLIPLGLTAAALAADAGIHKKILGLVKPTALIISNDEMKDIIEIFESLEDSGLLPKGVRETIQNEAKEQKEGLLSILLGILGASLLGNILAGKGINRAKEEAIPKSISEETNSKRQGQGIVSAGYGNKKGRKATTIGHKNKMEF